MVMYMRYTVTEMYFYFLADSTDGDGVEDVDASLSSSEVELSPRSSESQASAETQESQAAKDDATKEEVKEGADETDRDRPSRLDIPAASSAGPQTDHKSTNDTVCCALYTRRCIKTKEMYS